MMASYGHGTHGKGETTPSAGMGLPDWVEATDNISEPCGSRFSGDLTGFGRCVTRINRADSASGRNLGADRPPTGEAPRDDRCCSGFDEERNLSADSGGRARCGGSQQADGDLDGGDLAHQFGTDGAAGAGHQHAPPLQLRRHAFPVKLHRITPEQILHGHFAQSGQALLSISLRY